MTSDLLADGRKELAELEARCTVASIGFKTESDPVARVVIDVPFGRRTVPRSFYSVESLRALLGFRFEDCVLLEGYDAVLDRRDSVITALVRRADANVFPMTPSWIARVFGVSPSEIQRGDMRDLELELAGERNSQLRFAYDLVEGPAILLTAARRMGVRNLQLRIRPSESVSEAHEAAKILERLANAFFFQVDMRYGTALTLRRSGDTRSRVGPHLQTSARALEFPQHAYDSEPMQLYWYARSATGMPLLQFLAFYQTIEYYFPIYSQAQVRQRLQQLMKRPGFDVQNPTDAVRLIETVRQGPSGAIDSERSMLLATLEECVNTADLREFIAEGHVGSLTEKVQGLTDTKISIDIKNPRLVEDVRDRIYDIRCRIVHTKTGRESAPDQMLLPFSTAVSQLSSDIALMQFLAREVLINASRPLRD